MKLLVIVIALLSDRYLMHALSSRRFIWFPNYAKWVSKRMPAHVTPNQYPWLYLLLIILPLLLIVGFVLGVANVFLWGLFCWPLHFFIFYYCLGPNNPFYPCVETGEKVPAVHTAETADLEQAPVNLDNITTFPSEILHKAEDKNMIEDKQAMACYFSDVNGALFAVIFWYIVAGPLGVLFYRLVALTSSKVSEAANISADLVALFDWIPARITAIFYLLVGNFQRGIRWVIEQFFSVPANNATFLSQTGLLAVRSNEKDILSMPDAENLVWHAVILCLTLLAGFTLMAWL
ncbi:MAG: hypothetical protein H2069_05700 [Legionella sp.]|nr:hypothetical protein [Legionella sp.]